MMGSASDGTGAAVGRAIPTAPIPANTLANKQAAASAGLYQSCISLRERLWTVPRFGPEFLEPYAGNGIGVGRQSGPMSAYSDPVTHLWQCFRLGTPLCQLYNQLAPEVNEIPLTVEANLSNANACKALVMRFLIALKEKLGWDPDDTFTVSQLYLNDTNGFVRVVRTVNKLLDLLADRNLLLDIAPHGAGGETDYLDSPSDQRMHVVRELLESERKYVHDLEIMQNYAMMLSQTDTLSSDTIYLIFGNLHQLVDVQRRFLICVEDNARRPAQDQRFGGIFRDMEDDFSVYEPFCANYAQALDVINGEAPNLSRAKLLPAAQSCYLDPSYELPTFLIKPVQRICKYPLLLDQLLKSTPTSAPWYDELADALPIIRRITDKVNETSRLQENIQAVKDLELRVEDWKGHTLKSFGNLLHTDIFLVSKGDSEREFHVYLFERILLCCKDLGSPQIVNPLSSSSSRGRSKNNSILKQQRQGSVSGTSQKRDPRSPLQLKGRIFMNNIVGINAVGRSGGFPDNPIGTYSLQVWWRGESEVESFSLKCKNDEQLRLWQNALQKLLDDLTMRRQQNASQATTPTPGSGPPSGSGPPQLLHLNLAGTQYSGRANRGAFMQVATPIVSTPSHELGMPRRLTQRNQSQGSQRSDEDGADTPASVTPTFAPPTRSYTESDAIAMHEGRLPYVMDERPMPTAEEWTAYTTRMPPRGDPTLQNSLHSSPISPVTQSKPNTPTTLPLLATTRGMMSSSNVASAPISPRQAAPVLGRSSSAAPVQRMKQTIPNHLVMPTDGLEQDILGMNISSVPVQRTGFAAARAASNAGLNALSGAGMQRTASDGVAIRAAGPASTSMLEEAISPTTASPLNGWNPYFPTVPSAGQGQGQPETRNSSGGLIESTYSSGRTHTGYSSLHTSPTARKTSESSGSILGAGSGNSIVHHSSWGMDSFATPSTPNSPYPSWSTLQVRLACGGDRCQFAMPDSMSFLALYEQVQERLAAPRPSAGDASNLANEKPRLYYLDDDGDQVLMLDDDDLAMALDHSRMLRRNQLDVIVK